MRCWLVLVVVVAACGNSAPPPTIANTPPPAPPRAVTSCRDVGVILRGELSSGDEQAGRAREQLIEKACRDDKWPRPVIDCVASTPHPQNCLDKLDEAQLTAFEDRLRKWDDEYGLDNDSGPHMQLQVATCEELLQDTTQYPPALADKAAERDWQTKARRDFLHEECDHAWSQTMKDCVEDAGNERAEIEACLTSELPADERDELTKALGDIAGLATKIAAAKTKPATITCKQVVTKHYGDPQWKQKLDGYKPDERKKMIAASRTVMTTACTADQWSDTMRACVVLRGGDICFDDKNKRKWGYPATGAVTSVGIAECDEYAAAVSKLSACNMLPQSSRDSIVRSQQQMLAEIARVPAADRAKMGTSCKAGMDAIAMSLSNAGC